MSEQWKNSNQQIIDEFRANGGKVGGQFARANLLILRTIGAKSGQLRESPVAYFADDDGSMVVVASKAGLPRTPPGTTTSRRTRSSTSRWARRRSP